MRGLPRWGAAGRAALAGCAAGGLALAAAVLCPERELPSPGRRAPRVEERVAAAVRAAAARPAPSADWDAVKRLAARAAREDPFAPDVAPHAPPPSPTAAVAAPPPPPPPVRVAGIAANGAGGGSAIVQVGSHPARVLRVGEEFEGVRLTAVSGDAARFRVRDSTLVVPLPSSGP